MDLDGYYVRPGANTLGRALQTGHGSPGRADPPLRRGRLVGETLRLGNYDDIHLLDLGRHRLPDWNKTNESARR